MNIDILGITELKWTGMGEFNSDDHYIYYCGQESLRINGVEMLMCLILNKILALFHINKEVFQVLTLIFSQEKEHIVWQLKYCRHK